MQGRSSEFQYAMHCEGKYLERCVKDLQSAIDVEAESMSAEDSSAILLQDLRNEDSAVCDNNKIDDTIEDYKEGHSEKPTSKLRSRFPRRIEGKNLGKMVVGAEEKSEVRDVGVQSSVIRSDSSSSSSRVRNKLQAARDETYFLDEDQFLFS